MSGGEWFILAILGPVDLVALWFVWRHRTSIDRMISTAVNRWLLAKHKPEDLGVPGEPEQWCLACRKPWPCVEWEKLHEAVRERAP